MTWSYFPNTLIRQVIGVRDLFIFLLGGGGGTHIIGPFCPNPESTARIPARAEQKGGGGGGARALVFHRARNLFYIFVSD